MKPGPSLDDIYDLTQPEFNHVDQLLGDRNRRGMAISAVPQLERDLYLVFDIVCITNNAGMMAWIHYHHDEEGWIDNAREAFIRIGHPDAAKGLRECLGIYRDKGGEITSDNGNEHSRYIYSHENEVMQSLYVYLRANGFDFPHFGK